MNNVEYKDENAIITETINGKEYMMSPRPAMRHARAAGNIYHIFRRFVSVFPADFPIPAGQAAPARPLAQKTPAPRLLTPQDGRL